MTVSSNNADEVTRSIEKAGRFALFGLVSLCVVAVTAWTIGAGPNADPPYEFKQMVDAAKADTSDARIRESFAIVDREYVWRLRLSPDQLDAVLTDRELPESHDLPDNFSAAFPLLWRPVKTKASRFFATEQFPFTSRGPDGDHYAAMYDSEQQFFYVRFKGNF